MPFEMVEDIPVQRFPVNADLQRMSTVLLQKALVSFRKTRDWPDVVQFLSHSMWNAPYILSARLRGVPFLFVSTMIGSEEKDKKGGQRLKQWMYNQLLFQPLNCLVTSSGVMTQRMVERGVPSNRIEAIPNGVNLQRFHPVNSPAERNMIRRELGFKSSDEIILFVGIISPRKGVDTLISAWAEIARQRSRARLVLVGHRTDQNNTAIPESFRDQAFMDMIDTEIALSPSPNSVVFTGRQSNVEAYMRAADVFVFPSKNEGMPNVVPEAMATGLSCVVTPFVGLPSEFGEPNREYKLVQRTPETISTAIVELLENRNLREMMGKVAHQWVQSHLDVEFSMDRFAQLYRRLAGKIK